MLKERWCNNRLNNLANNNNFKQDNGLYTIENLNSIHFTQFKLPDVQGTSFVTKETKNSIKNINKKEKKEVIIDYEYLINKQLNDKIIIEIMNRKKEIITTHEISDFIKKNYNIYINRNVISKLWNNQIPLPEHLQNTQEYKEMISNEKKRTKKLTKFTEEELDFVRNNIHSDLNKCANAFYSKFNKTITTEYITILQKRRSPR
jgi:hypothetical protein